jgi:asparagine synthase (glutamine-hydrolysing)
MVFNGCIYHHRALRAELVGQGERFTTDHSDTEALLRAWGRWGEAAWSKAEGMFAAAAWDGAAGTLTLARDRYGEKPLYFAPIAAGLLRDRGAWGYAFASVAAALWPFVEPSGVGAEGWLRFGAALDPPAGLRAVPPAASVVLSAAGELMTDHRPGEGAQAGLSRGSPRREAPLTIDGAERLLAGAVASRLEADVPLGCFLSGGVDSAVVAAMAVRALGGGTGGGSRGAGLDTFTVRMPDAAFDESEAAAIVARAIGARHTVLECAPNPAEDLVALIDQLGLPLGDSSLLPTHWVSRAAREHVKVCLSGDGGDELFVGYERYKAAAWLDGPARRALALIPSGVLPRHDPRSRWAKLARLGEAARGRGYVELVSVFPSPLLARLLESPVRASFPAAWHGAMGREVTGTNGTLARGKAGAIAWDVDHYLPNDLLCKVDAASMSVGLEVRAPMLDGALSSACLAAPLADLLGPGRGLKGLLRAVARRAVGEASPAARVFDRPKSGFAIPIGEWFRSNHGRMRTLLLDQLGSAEPFGPAALGLNLRPREVRRLIDEHQAAATGAGVDHGQRLYLLLVLSLWAKGVARRERLEPTV